MPGVKERPSWPAIKLQTVTDLQRLNDQQVRFGAAIRYVWDILFEHTPVAGQPEFKAIRDDIAVDRLAKLRPVALVE
jgi:hypothetical protein